MEQQIIFLSDNLEIEGLFDKQSKDKGVVITHPHPLYGGDMHSFVVEAITQAYQEKGYTTLRFNFRGVGRSQGVHEDGVGEQNDVLAAISFLAKEGIKNIDLAGYSFGTWVSALAVQRGALVEHMVMVSPPVEFLDFKSISSIPCLKLVITGSRDDIAPVDSLAKMLPKWNPKAGFEVINGADHSYMGFNEKIKSVISSYL